MTANWDPAFLGLFLVLRKMSMIVWLKGFDPTARLDEGILRAVWMTPDEIHANAHRHRSPLLAKCLEQTPGVRPVVVENGWPKDGDEAAVFKDAKTVAFFMDGGGGQPMPRGASRDGTGHTSPLGSELAQEGSGEEEERSGGRRDGAACSGGMIEGNGRDGGGFQNGRRREAGVPMPGLGGLAMGLGGDLLAGAAAGGGARGARRPGAGSRPRGRRWTRS